MIQMNLLLIAFTLCLLVIVAGMKLLAQTQKDNLGNLYKYVSMFIIVMGFLSLLCVGVHCIMGCCHRGEHRMMMRKCRMMDNDCSGVNGCGDEMGCERGMRHNDRCMMQSGDCNMSGNCIMNGKCSEGSDCKEDMNSNCPMMNSSMHHTEKDTVIIKKERKQ
jgi:hypothetical protein